MKGNSQVEVAWFIDAGRPTLHIVVSDPDGVGKVTVWSRFGRVPTIRTYRCEKTIEDNLVPYPVAWFPITVDVTDCQKTKEGQPNPQTDRHGPFNSDGEIVPGAVKEPNDTSKPPGPYKPPQDEEQKEKKDRKEKEKK